jgi:diguanylate cyclase (GGDEF)-like protein/PAS domain S-box-containing protein
MEFVSEGALELTGYEPADLIASHTISYNDLIHPDDREYVWNAVQAALREDTVFRLVYRIVTADQREKWVWEQGRAVLDRKGNPLFLEGFITNITERKLAQEQLKFRALYDNMTGLGNRAMFLDRLGLTLQQVQQQGLTAFAVLFLDIDRFAIINDSLGHAVGDKVLKEIAHRLERLVSSLDSCARLGGDEFGILLPNIKNTADATRIARRIQKELALPIHLNGHNIYLTLSVGIAVSKASYEHSQDILRDAETALHRIKAEGKGQCEIFDKSMHHRALKQLEFESDLHQALAQNELQVLYQPIITLDDNKLAGFETLLRWNHPRKGLIPTHVLVNTAEESGLIHELDLWTLRCACEQMRRWQRTYPDSYPLIISSNISARNFEYSDLPGKIHLILEEFPLKPYSLWLEITESTIIKNWSLIRDIVRQMKEKNVILVMDDFGTGYSSLSALHNLNIDCVKIDQSFIRRIESTSDSREIIRTIALLAHHLNLKVVAEGIETPGQRGFLRELKVDYGQGHIFAPALDAAAAEKFITYSDSAK